MGEEARDPTPLVLAEGRRLYLYRWWRAERDVARLLRKRAEAAGPPPTGARDAFERFFEAKAGHAPASGQAVAAVGALCSPLTVVTGGPGTGKTYAAARLLALLLSARPDLDVALAAPTGKAAKRLGASIAREAQTLDLPGDARAALPTEAQTLHRLLGYRPRENRFRFHTDRPLDVDAVLVDESSMIDLLLFKALLEALPDRARLIFLGDAHQIASIGAGRVLVDLVALGGSSRSPAFARYCRRVGAGRVPIGDKGDGTGGIAKEGIEHAPLRDAVVTLRTNYRFGAGSGIAALAGAVRDGDADRAVSVLDRDGDPEVRRVPHPAEPSEGHHEGPDANPLDDATEHARALCRAGSAGDALAQKDRFQVLVATYGGPWGAHAVNDFVERALLHAGDRRAGRFYPGRLVLVTANDYERGLFNGDVGVCVADGGRLHACFDRTDGDEDGNEPRAVPLSQLPQHESAWAVTVHKSQGSEYDEVLLLLPTEMRPPLCRELLYTAVTRARERVTIVGPEAVVRAAVAAPERRPSGLPRAMR